MMRNILDLYFLGIALQMAGWVFAGFWQIWQNYQFRTYHRNIAKIGYMDHMLKGFIPVAYRKKADRHLLAEVLLIILFASLFSWLGLMLILYVFAKTLFFGNDIINKSKYNPRANLARIELFENKDLSPEQVLSFLKDLHPGYFGNSTWTADDYLNFNPDSGNDKEAS